ncbi:MAG TPA: helicase c2 [Nitrospirae bacterium]|nr:helicase c2 [Nitrospirota bacterium]
MIDELTGYFGTGGSLSSCLDGYEYRPEQHEMAEKVLSALRGENHLIVEAGTGVGMSSAYLIPLIEHVSGGSAGRVVVSTYTKALQRQLVEKDLPFLKENLFPDIGFALCLGSENYLCLRRLDISRQHGLFDPGDEGEMRDLLEWSESTDTGLYMEISPSFSLWSKICREHDLCHGRDCRFYDGCPYQRAKDRERKSRILVTNHHLFFAHIASGWNVLPGFETVVFDEAHEVERVASDYLGVEVSNTKLRYLLDSILSKKRKGLLARLSWLDDGRFSGIAAIVERVRGQGERFFADVAVWLGQDKAKRIRSKGQFVDIITEHLDTLRAEIYKLYDAALDKEEKKDIHAIEERCRVFIDSMETVLEQGLEGYVYWTEVDGRKTRLSATPIEPGGILRPQLFEVVSPVILTSATLSVRGSFSYIKDRLGLEEADTMLLESPFAFREQMLLYLPGGLPMPGADDYDEGIYREVERILGLTGGRTLVLFTNYAMLNRVCGLMRLKGISVLKQGEADSYTLINRFKADGHSVLFGTYTFWQGVDIPGDDLQCVVITKLPFSVPTDPVVEARMEALSEEGKDPFYSFQVPQAIITFKQGFGRLIRTARDHGIVAVLDSRIKRRAYGRAFLESIPEVEIVRDMDTLRERFEKQKLNFQPGEAVNG